MTTPTRVEVVAPTGFVEAAEGAVCTVSNGTCNVDLTGPGQYDVAVEGGTGLVDVAVSFAYRPAGLYDTDSPPPLPGTFEITAADAGGSFPVTVFDPWPVVRNPPPIDADVLYFANAAGGDVDRYDVDVSEYAPGSHVAVRLSNLTDDADLVLVPLGRHRSALLRHRHALLGDRSALLGDRSALLGRFGR